MSISSISLAGDGSAWEKSFRRSVLMFSSFVLLGFVSASLCTKKLSPAGQNVRRITTLQKKIARIDGKPFRKKVTFSKNCRYKKAGIYAILLFDRVNLVFI